MFGKLKQALSKTRDKLSSLFGKKIDPETLEQLEELLYEADIGIACSEKLIASLKTEISPEALKETARSMLACAPKELIDVKLRVILIVGVNGSGKTTSCAKLAKRLQEDGKSVLLAAADTFRAAAGEQLSLWANKLGIDIVGGAPGADPSSVVFDALTAAKSRSIDTVLIDTAGRLQSKSELMRELEKIGRVCDKVVPGSPHETWLVVDATMGQKRLDQAKAFREYVPLTGLILTKLDSSAKGGIALAIHHELDLPVEYVGVGEGADDMIPFNVDEYVDALFAQ